MFSKMFLKTLIRYILIYVSFFFNRLLKDIEIRYWFTKLKFINIV